LWYTWKRIIWYHGNKELTADNLEYHHTYSKVIKELPVINLGTPRDKKWFSPSKLAIVPHQIYRRLVPDHLTDTMLMRAAKIPAECVPIIKRVFDFLKINDPQGTETIFVSSSID
jgi:hypothetical protein